MNVAEELSNDEGHEPVEQASAASSDTFDLVVKNFAHHHPGNGSESEGEENNEQTDGKQRQPADGVDSAGVVDLHVEVDSEDEGSQAHGNAGNQEQHSPAETIDNQRADEDSDHLHGSNDDCRDAGVQGASSGFEYGARVENNRVDSTELLEEHQPESDQQSLDGCF